MPGPLRYERLGAQVATAARARAHPPRGMTTSWVDHRARSRPPAPEHPLAVGSLSKAQLDALVAQATVDCYNEDEQVTGLFTLIEDNLAMPFETHVFGVRVTVERVDLTDSGQIVAICSREQARQAHPDPRSAATTPTPAGAEWIDAYRHWER